MKKTVDLSKFSNSWYKPGNIFIRSAWYICNRLFLKTSIPYPSGLKTIILKIFGAKAGNGIVLKPNINIKYPWLLQLGDNVWIGENCWIDNLGNVEIGSNVCVSQGTYIFCGNHDFKKENFDLKVEDIKIENGVWIGAKSVICPGVTLKSHSVISVGSIITSDTVPYSIYKSFTTKKIKSRIIE